MGWLAVTVYWEATITLESGFEVIVPLWVNFRFPSGVGQSFNLAQYLYLVTSSLSCLAQLGDSVLCLMIKWLACISYGHRSSVQ